MSRAISLATLVLLCGSCLIELDGDTRGISGASRLPGRMARATRAA